MMAGHAQGSALPVPPQSSLYNGELAQKLAYSRDEARKLCKDTGMSSELRLIVNRESVFKAAMAKELGRQLEEAGLSVKTETMSWKEYREALKAGNYDLYLGEVVLGANFDLSPLLDKKGSLNFSGYETKELSAAAKAYHQAGRDSRADAAAKLFTQLSQEAPFVPVCFKCESILSRTGSLVRLTPTQSNRFYHFWEWVLDEQVVEASNEQ
jgi:peptide/nickel transport system substrate-binding protein